VKDYQPACYTQSILQYQPVYGDYLIWSKWFSTWHGFLYEQKDSTLTFMMAGLPVFLTNKSGRGQKSIMLDLNKIRNSKGGKFAVIRYERDKGLPIWYV
jgi:hypothetical protein